MRISSVNLTKSAKNCRFGHVTEEIPNGKLHFLCSDSFQETLSTLQLRKRA